MKRITATLARLSMLLFIFPAIYPTVSCSRLDDLEQRVDVVENRVLALEHLCTVMNKDIEALKALLQSLEKQDCIIGIEEIQEDGVPSSYVICMKSGKTITISNGKDGATPVIGVKEGENGIWYWTIDGEWILDADSNRLQVNGITPQMRIIDGYWQVSYDGKEWTTIGRASGKDSVFRDVDLSGDDYVEIILSNGTSLSIPKYKALDITFDTSSLALSPDSEIMVAYTLSGASYDTVVETMAEGVEATVIVEDYSSGCIRIRSGSEVPGDAKVLVFVSDGSTTIMKTLKLSKSRIEVAGKTEFIIPYSGGEVQIDVLANTPININIPPECEGWITELQTKALYHIGRTLSVASNAGPKREVTVSVFDRNSNLSVDYRIVQEGHPDFYQSEDYSMDGEVTVLQEAGTGEGLNIVFLGDGYTDRLISDGTYEKDIRQAMEYFFSVQPFTAMRDRFNCYMVNAVSKNENYLSGSSTIFECSFKDGSTFIGVNGPRAAKYAYKVEGMLDGAAYGGVEELDGELFYWRKNIKGSLLIVVVLNSDRYAGTSYLYFNYDLSIALCPKQSPAKSETFRQLVHHEACGHGFGKLADEYVSGYDMIPDSRKNNLIGYQNNYKVYMNVSLTDDQASVNWAHMISDSRYSDKVGIYEGGYTCKRGVWRPTNRSIMYYNTGGFNAYSRELIYKRIMEKSEGSSYVYDFEDFAAFDSSCDESIPVMLSRESASAEAEFIPLAPPVVVEMQ